MWVHLFDDALKSQAGVDRVLDDAASAGVNAVFVQVIRRHDAYYGSKVLPRTPDPALAPGFDVLAAAVDGGHARGMQIHAWITVATAWHESYRGLELPAGHVIGDHGPDGADPWMTVSRAGVQSREYFDIGLPELHHHVAGMVTDIAARSAVDGVRPRLRPLRRAPVGVPPACPPAIRGGDRPPRRARAGRAGVG